MEPSDRPTALLRDAVAVALGLVVPAMVSGRAVLQGLAAAALVGALIIAWRDRAIFARAAAAIRSRFGICILVAFAAMTVSIPGSLDPVRSFEAWARTLGYLGGCVLFWAFLRSRADHARRALDWLVFGITAAASLVFIGQLGFTLPLQAVRNVWSFFDSDWPFLAPKAFAAAAVCTVPLLAWTGLTQPGTRRWAAVAGILMIVYITIGTGNKSALAGLLAAGLLVTLAVAARRGRKWLAVWLGWAVVASGLVLSLVYELPDSAPSNAVWPWVPAHIVDTHRQQIWHFTAGKIAEKPWTGYGPNSIDRVAGAHEKPPGYDVEYLPSHPHNWVLEILGETGVIGFLPVLFALIWHTARHFRRYLGGGSAQELTQLGLIAVFWGSSLFNFSIWSSWWLITFFLLSALIAVSRRETPPA